jgi:hypothetical protein
MEKLGLLVVVLAVSLGIKELRVQNNAYVWNILVRFPPELPNNSMSQSKSYRIIPDLRFRWEFAIRSVLVEVIENGAKRKLTVMIPEGQLRNSGFDLQLIREKPLNQFYTGSGYAHKQDGVGPFKLPPYVVNGVRVEISENLPERSLTIRITQMRGGHRNLREIILTHTLINNSAGNVSAVPM